MIQCRMVFFTLLALGLWNLICPIAAACQEPGFSFWGNLRCAPKIMKHSPQDRIAPMALTDPAKLEKCGIKVGMPLTLIRQGVLLGQGEVGEVLAGWIGRAGDDRVAWFVSTSLPDSVTIISEFTFPSRGDYHFDFYVLGDHQVEMVESEMQPVLSDEQFVEVVGATIEAGIFSVLDFPYSTGEDGTQELRIPEARDAAKWIGKKTDPVALTAWNDTVEQIEVVSCPPYFVTLHGNSMVRPVFLRGYLDFFLEIDGNRYMVMRTGKAGTGGWAYCVYLLKPGVEPKLVYADGSWST